MINMTLKLLVKFPKSNFFNLGTDFANLLKRIINENI